MSVFEAIEARADRCCADPDPAPGLRAFAVVHSFQQLVQAVGEIHAPLVTILCGAAVLLSWRRARLAMGLLAVAGLLSCISRFPVTANHVYLGALTSIIVLVLDPGRQAHQRITRAHLCALPLVALAWGGVTKLLHGSWFQGQAMSALFVSRVDIRATLSAFMTTDDADRLARLSFADGAGPFVLLGPLILAANAMWATELVLPFALVLWRRLASRAWWLLSGTVVGIQLVAHEWTFAFLLLNLASLMAPSRAAWRMRALLVAGLVALGAAQLGLVHPPGWFMPTVFRTVATP